MFSSDADATLKSERAFAGRIPALDGMRGLAIAMVVIHHYLPSDVLARRGWPAGVVVPLTYGWAGVDLFFVLSGFLISGILFDTRGDEHYASTFYARRSLRILPLYVVLLIAFAGGRIWFGPTAPFEADLPVWGYLLFVQNILMTIDRSFGSSFLEVTWSLAIEEQFYLLLPPVIRRVRREKALAAIACAAIILAPVFRILWTAFAEPYYGPYLLLPSRMDALGFCLAVAIASRDRRVWRFMTKRPGILYGVGLSILVVGLVAEHSLPTGSPVKRGIGYSLVDGMVALFLISSLARHAAGRHTLLEWPALQWLGSVSYAVYLFHVGLKSVADAIWKGVAGSPLPGLAALAATLLMAEASRRWFEGPCRRYARRWSYSFERNRLPDRASPTAQVNA